MDLKKAQLQGSECLWDGGREISSPVSIFAMSNFNSINRDNNTHRLLIGRQGNKSWVWGEGNCRESKFCYVVIIIFISGHKMPIPHPKGTNIRKAELPYSYGVRMGGWGKQGPVERITNL